MRAFGGGNGGGGPLGAREGRASAGSGGRGTTSRSRTESTSGSMSPRFDSGTASTSFAAGGEDAAAGSGAAAGAGAAAGGADADFSIAASAAALLSNERTTPSGSTSVHFLRAAQTISTSSTVAHDAQRAAVRSPLRTSSRSAPHVSHLVGTTALSGMITRNNASARTWRIVGSSGTTYRFPSA